jgi:arabinogalactan oligomer/maltooligosaccharide transport system substrate-binding protein
MNLAGAETSTGSDFIVSALPTYKGEHQATFVKTKGISINAYTEFQSAAHELARLIYSQDGFQGMVDSTAYPPSLVEGSALVPTLTAGGVQEQMMKGFLYSASEFTGTLPLNKNQTAMGAAYYQSFLNDCQIAIWDGTKTIDQAIADLVTVSDAALAAANVAP